MNDNDGEAYESETSATLLIDEKRPWGTVRLRKQPFSHVGQASVLLILGMAVGASIFYALISITWTSAPPQGRMVLGCGSSIEEAQQRNCTFDLLGTSWIPESCYDAETDAEFIEWTSRPGRMGGPFPLFQDEGLGTRLAGLTAVSNQSYFYPTEEWHRGHCIFMLKRLTRALRGGFDMTPPLVHMTHCVNFLLVALDTLAETADTVMPTGQFQVRIRPKC